MRTYNKKLRRLYRSPSLCFVTTNTYKGYPYFKDDILCSLLVDQIFLCQKLYSFRLFGFKINPDHVHLLIEDSSVYTYSKIVQCFKRNFARDCNRVLGYTEMGFATAKRKLRLSLLESENGSSGFELPPLGGYSEMLRKKYSVLQNHLPLFKWKKSFYCSLIFDSNYFNNCVKYLKKQWAKHDLKEDSWCFVDEELVCSVLG